MLVTGVRAGAAEYPDPALRTIFDIRVDRLSAHALLTEPPQRLVDPARQHAARTITDLRQGAFFAWAAAQIWALAWLWRSGRAAQLRDLLRRRLRARCIYRAAFGGSLGTLVTLAGLPFAFISYRIGFNVGLTEERIGAWLAVYAARTLIDALIASLVVAIVLEFVDRTRLWYLGFSALLVASTVSLVGIYPVAFAPLRTQLAPLHSAAAAPVEIANVSPGTRTLTARTAGIGSFTRIILGDVLIAAATPAELRYVVAYEDAHVMHRDELKLTLVATALFALAAAIALLISDRVGFRRDDDALSRLALVGALLGAVSLVMFPLYNAYLRGIEYRAGEDARRTLNDPVGAVRLLVRRADHDLIALCYRRSSSWYFADHPALGSAMAEMRGSTDPCPHSPATR